MNKEIGDLYLRSTDDHNKLRCDGRMYSQNDFPEVYDVFQNQVSYVSRPILDDIININLGDTGDSRGVFSDEDYIYIGHISGSHFTVLHKSDRSIVSGTPTLPGSVFDIFADDSYVYLGHANGDRFTVLDKSNWSIINTGLTLPFNVWGIYLDSEYIYIVHSSGNRFTVVDKSDWSIVSGTPSLPGNGLGVFVDNNYVYIAHIGGNNFTVVDKSDWSIVSGTPTLPGSGRAVYGDNSYIYIGHTDGDNFTVVDKSDWSIVSGTPTLPGTVWGVHIDDNYVFLGHEEGNYFTVVDKSDWSIIPDTPSLPNDAWAVYSDKDFVYIAHLSFGGLSFSIVDKRPNTPAPSGFFYTPNINSIFDSKTSYIPVQIKAKEVPENHPDIELNYPSSMLRNEEYQITITNYDSNLNYEASFNQSVLVRSIVGDTINVKTIDTGLSGTNTVILTVSDGYVKKNVPIQLTT